MAAILGFFVLAASLATASKWEPHHWHIPATYPNLTSCANTVSTYSCENTTAIENSCCSPTPGGLVLFTQFWSTYTGLESEGQLLPKASWTIHGAWPDNCDGSFEQYCDFSRQYDPSPSPSKLPNGTVIPPWTGPSVDSFIKAYGRYDLLDYLGKYWINQGSPNRNLWAHEFSKHATCTSTFDVGCYPDYKEHEEVINFFDTVVKGFRMFPTYDMLAAYSIVPSNKTTYTLSQLQSALKAQTGAVPYLGCINNGTSLDEVWYFGHVWGTEQYGHFKTIESTTPSSCSNATGAIHYYERSYGSEHEVR